MKRIWVIFGIVFLIILSIVIFVWFNLTNIHVDNISYEVVDGKIYADVKVVSYFKTFCDLDDKTILVENNHCKFEVQNKEMIIKIYSRFKSLNRIINPNINKVIDFETKDTYYLIIGEEQEINVDATVIGNPDIRIELREKDSTLLDIKENKIKGLNKGEAILIVKVDDIEKEVKVVVTDLIGEMVYNPQKELLPCNIYSSQDNDILDKLLEERVNKAGYKTRAAAVAAARFLTLEFPYRVPYFYENGRINGTGVHYADGEGRYYKKGLYLNDTRKEDIRYVYRGPSIWGCPLVNLEDAKEYGYYMGALMPNGLDCSGFISWVLFQAGFDPGDIGAGETPDAYQMTDLGDFRRTTDDILYSDKVKAGDLFNYWGHIAMIVGITDDDFYVAESLQMYKGVVVRKYSKKNVSAMFPYIVLMDSYYQNDGNYTEMF